VENPVLRLKITILKRYKPVPWSRSALLTNCGQVMLQNMSTVYPQLTPIDSDSFFHTQVAIMVKIAMVYHLLPNRCFWC
jgi:hypothetical protein